MAATSEGKGTCAPAGDAPNPCLACGACCVRYRASFHWSEADDAEGAVPVGLTDDLGPFRRVMRGTDTSDPRCVALEGTVGVEVRCAIYELRPSVCRDFTPSWADGRPNDMCDRARSARGLDPLTPDAWTRPTGRPRPRAA